MYLFLIYTPVMLLKLIFFKNDLIELFPIKMIEIYENDINEDIHNSKRYLFRHYIKLQKVKLSCFLFKYLPEENFL